MDPNTPVPDPRTRAGATSGRDGGRGGGRAEPVMGGQLGEDPEDGDPTTEAGPWAVDHRAWGAAASENLQSTAGTSVILAAGGAISGAIARVSHMVSHPRGVYLQRTKQSLLRMMSRTSIMQC